MDVWRKNPFLIVLSKELDEIFNRKIMNSKIHLRFHDWFYTNLFRQVEES